MKKNNECPGYISCCAVCKKIKNVAGDWISVDSNYLKSLAGKLSHGYCLSCYDNFIEEYDRLQANKAAQGLCCNA